jgi:site-specific DNA-methyltransferase (adenine-specific)
LLKDHHGCSATFNDNVPTQDYFNELRRVSNHQIIWGANNFGLPPTEYFCIWDKMQPMDNFASAEYAWCSPSLKMPAKVFRYSIMQHNADTKKIHPTQKPIKLYQWLLQTYAMESDRVLDTHLGSGSSAIAAHYFGCDFVGLEIDPAFYASAVKRFDEQTKQSAMF